MYIYIYIYVYIYIYGSTLPGNMLPGIRQLTYGEMLAVDIRWNFVGGR